MNKARYAKRKERIEEDNALAEASRLAAHSVLNSTIPQSFFFPRSIATDSIALIIQ
jgi:hypothetical protein